MPDAPPAFRPVAPPLWAQSVMGLVVVASAVSWIHITPLYFIAGAEYPEEGGFTGAIDVVTRGGTPDYILSAIPFFLILMATELVLTLVSGLQCVGGKYSIDDAWSSLAAGITQQIVVALVKVPLKINILPYAWIYYNIAVPNGFDKFAPVDKGWVWLATFIVVDLCYYWFHRSAHEIQLLWAGHGIHHQSEYYNLSTALRQSWWASLSGWIFYLPMALMIHPLLYATLDGANVVYQFWVHTCMVRRLPETLEFVLMTPSHHRVHHDRRVHKNFGGFLIIWDRIFGSFQDEYETVRPLKAQQQAAQHLPQEEVMLFGSASTVKTWTEVVTQTQFWSPITRAVSQGGMLKAARIGPGFYTTGAKRDIKPPSASATRIRKVSDLPLPGKLYVVAAFLGVSVATAFIVMLFSSKPWPLRAVGGGCALWALFCQGLLLDADGGKGRSMEAVRCLVCMGLCFVMHGCGSGKIALDGVLGLGPEYREILSSGFMQSFLKVMTLAHMAALSLLAVSPRSFVPAPAKSNVD